MACLLSVWSQVQDHSPQQWLCVSVSALCVCLIRLVSPSQRVALSAAQGPAMCSMDMGKEPAQKYPNQKTKPADEPHLLQTKPLTERTR